MSGNAEQSGAWVRMTRRKQIWNDIVYVMWALGLTGWISAIQRRIPKRHKAGTDER